MKIINGISNTTIDFKDTLMFTINDIPISIEGSNKQSINIVEPFIYCVKKGFMNRIKSCIFLYKYLKSNMR